MIRVKFDPQLPYQYIRYARMSTDMQNPRSPEQQFECVATEVCRIGQSWVHVGDYRDDGRSGRIMRKRPGFKKMLEDIFSGRVQCDLILVDTLERFGHMEELAALRRKLQNRYGVLILTADSHFADPTSVAGQALGMVECMRATGDAHVKAHNVRRGKFDAARQHHWPGGPPPIGLRLKSVMKANTQPAEVDHRILDPDPEKVPVPQKMFTLALEKGWGGFRIAKFLNDDDDFVARYGRISGSTVNYILDNPIYIGTLRFNRNATGILDDRRVTMRNDEDEVIYVEDFCEPIIAREVFDAVAQQRRTRSTRIRAARRAKATSNGKQIKPPAPGVTLKYPLTGLVRCGVCGVSMRPTKPGGSKYNYYYYACPSRHDGRCGNRRGVRGDWLWQVFVSRLREELFPLPPAGGAGAPDWLVELISEVHADLVQRHKVKQDQRPLLERERDDLGARLTGWTQSLANPALAPETRRHLEHELNQAFERRQQLDTEIAALDGDVRRVGEMLDVNAAVECLQRLHEVLNNANPTTINLELARHIQAIDIHPDGRVVIRTNRLGIFKGVTEELASPEGVTQPPAASGGHAGDVKPRQALLTRRVCEFDVIAANGQSPLLPPDVLKRVKLPDKWLKQTVVRMPNRHSWAELHAAEVHQKRAETGWSQQRLAEHFGKTPPTIRHALRIAEARAEGQ